MTVLSPRFPPPTQSPIKLHRAFTFVDVYYIYIYAFLFFQLGVISGKQLQSNLRKTVKERHGKARLRMLQPSLLWLHQQSSLLTKSIPAMQNRDGRTGSDISTRPFWLLCCLCLHGSEAFTYAFTLLFGTSLVLFFHWYVVMEQS